MSTEVIGAVLIALGGLFTAFGIYIRAKAKGVEANAKRLEADAQVKVSNAEAELAERLSLTKQFEQTGELLKSQIVINQQLKERADAAEMSWQKRLAEKEKQDEQNYRVLSQTQDRLAAELHNHLKSRFDGLERKIDALPAALQADTKEWIQTVVGEVATQIAERFAEMTLAQEWYPFPDMSDPEWHDEFVKPLVNRVRLYRRPVSSESCITDIEIPPTGSNLKIIKGRKKGWLVVRRAGGAPDAEAVYGWVLEHEVLTGMAAIKRATHETAALTALSPASG